MKARHEPVQGSYPAEAQRWCSLRAGLEDQHWTQLLVSYLPWGFQRGVAFLRDRLIRRHRLCWTQQLVRCLSWGLLRSVASQRHHMIRRRCPRCLRHQ